MDKENKRKKERDVVTEIAATGIYGQPDTALKQINKYGTYEIQPTSDSDNDFPKIAQGLPKPQNRKLDLD